MAMPNISGGASTAYAFAVMGLLAFAAWRDIAIRTIPDAISIALVALGVAFRLSQGVQPFGMSLLIAIVVFVSLVPLCSRGLLGGADIKLLAALAAGLSPQGSLHLLAAVTMVGGGLAAAYLLLNKLTSLARTGSHPSSRATSLLGRIVRIEFWRIRRGAPLPYGIAIAAGAAFVVFNQQGV